MQDKNYPLHLKFRQLGNIMSHDVINICVQTSEKARSDVGDVTNVNLAMTIVFKATHIHACYAHRSDLKAGQRNGA